MKKDQKKNEERDNSEKMSKRRQLNAFYSFDSMYFSQIFNQALRISFNQVEN